jgi:hypothetical protein
MQNTENHEPRPQTKPDLRLIEDKTSDGPEGPFFVETYPGPIDYKHLKRFAEDPSISTVSLLRHVASHIGMIPSHQDEARARGELANFENAPHNERREHYLEQVIRSRSVATELFETIYQSYQEMFWDDFKNRRGQQNDMLDELWDATEQYENTTFLQTMIWLRQNVAKREVIADAERVTRMIIINEITPIDPD